jgi:hypothetical protein
LVGAGNDNDRWVIPYDGGWAVAKEDRERVSGKFERQSDAIDRAREIISNLGGGELVVLGEDGRIRQKDTIAPGNDPSSSPG